MCSCVNVTIGGYENQTELPRPDHMKGRKEGSESDTICIDTCIVQEIKDLWAKGIRTTGCCCGHNIHIGFVGVIQEDIPKMLELGYVPQFNPMRPGGNDQFTLKTV